MNASPESVFRFIVEQMDKSTTAINFVPLAEALGISAFTVADLDHATNDVLNAQSTMDSKWLSHYANEGYFNVDPFINQAWSRGGSISVTAGQLSFSDVTDPDSLRLNHGLKDAGYEQLLGTGYQTQSDEVTRWVSLCFSQSASTIDPAAIASFSIALNSFHYFDKSTGMSPVSRGDSILSSPASKITLRERDALSYLAEGRRISQIAFSMGISETMVHRHLTSCQQKLGARTREQLIIMALRHRIIQPA